MQFTPTTEQFAMINYAIASGRFSAPEEAVSDALDMWLARERARFEMIASLKAAEADIAAGRYTDYDDSTLDQLVEELTLDTDTPHGGTH
jgi:Arc/MetJ-type ribon-helix-helix transcriptional regulator